MSAAGTAAARLRALYPVLRHRDFALVWSGGVVSTAGDWLLALALPYHVYARTGSATASAALFVTNMAPRVLFGSVGGVFADRLDRRRTMLTTDLLRALVVLCMLPAALSDAWVWIAFPLVFCEATASVFFRPAKGALLPRLVPEEELLAANALDQVADGVLRLVAPLAGGVLLGALGLASVLVADAATYLASAALVLKMQAPAQTPPASTEAMTPLARWVGFWRDWLDGLGLVARAVYLRNVFLVAGAASIASGVVNPLLVPYIQDVLGAGPELLGAMVTATGVGALATGVVLGRTTRVPAPARLAAGGQLLLGAALLTQFHLRDATAMVVLSAPVGVVFATGTGFGTALQARVAEELRGRVLGAFGTTWSLAMVVGSVAAGVLPGALGLPPVLDAAGLLYIAAGTAGLVLLTDPAPGAATGTARAR